MKLRDRGKGGQGGAHSVDVAVLEPDPAVRAVLERALARWGLDTISSGDGTAGMAEIFAAGPRLWLLASDAGGERTGAMLEGIRKRMPDAPVLLLVGAMPDDFGIWRGRATRLLVKPLDFGALKCLVETHLGRDASG
ncbi:MAG: hypothetical protein WEB88_12440 [Gemmatimonadota bacterium]